MTVNVELLEQTMQQIVDNPELHNQKEVFDCGTPACFVGWAMHLSGLTESDMWELGSCLEWAAENFGVSLHHAQQVFVGSNTIPMLQLMVKDLVNEGVLTKSNLGYLKEAHPEHARCGQREGAVPNATEVESDARYIDFINGLTTALVTNKS